MLIVSEAVKTAVSLSIPAPETAVNYDPEVIRIDADGNEVSCWN
jgi:hypothetical protein